MKKFFILMLFALNMVYFQQAVASSPIDQTIIFYADEDKPDEGSGGDGDAKEEDCE
jgi:hypothetical protein